MSDAYDGFGLESDQFIEKYGDRLGLTQPPPPDPLAEAQRRRRWTGYTSPFDHQKIGLGGSTIPNKTLAPQDIMSGNGQVLVGRGSVVDQNKSIQSIMASPNQNKSYVRNPMLDILDAMDNVRAGAGVKPGRQNPINAVQADRLSRGQPMGIGGSNVTMGMGPAGQPQGPPDPRKAALAAYPGAGAQAGR